jgi:rhodanese-related sulfurtransferase
MSKYDLKQAQDYFAARLAFTTGVHELEVLNQKPMKDAIIVDVRYPRDFAAGHVPGAINLPKHQWHQPKGLDPRATLYVYCYDQTCHMAAEAARALTRQGYKVVEVEGGWGRWQARGFPKEIESSAA